MRQFCLVFLILVQFLTAESRIVFTGNAQSYLEPCGCVDGMLGGIARRPQAIPDERSLFLDSGNFTEVRDELDRLRNEFYARSFEPLGYDAVGLGSSEATQPLSWLQSLEGHPLFVSGNLMQANGSPAFRKSAQINDYTVVALLENEELHSDYSVEPATEFLAGIEGKNLILLSSLHPENLGAVIAMHKDRIDLVIANRARGDFARLMGVPVVYAGDKGKIVRSFNLETDKFQTTPVEEDFELNPSLQTVVDDYYQAVAESPSLQKVVRRLHEDGRLEQQVLAGKNKYIGSQNCKSCHSEQFHQHASTVHASAFNILMEKNRAHVPDCVKCHSVGFGYESGYEISSRQKHLQNVGCESCHGPGLEHYRNPRKDNIYKQVSEARCQACHNQEHSPNFDYDAWLPMVNHSIPAPGSQKQPEPVKLSKPDVDLYVMSQCPFGVKAENAVIPVVQEIRDDVDFDLRFIATANEAVLNASKGDSSTATETAQTKEEDSAELPEKAQAPAPGTPGCQANFELDPNAKFQSLHGQPEVDENIRQLLVEHHYPNQFLDFLQDRNQDIYGDFAAVAKRHGIDPQKIEEGMQSGLGDELLVENIRPGNELGISASPTMRINDQPYTLPYEEVPLKSEICRRFSDPPAWCSQVPPCAKDAHCKKPGMDGRCVAAGTDEARCEFTQPLPVELTVIRDDSCRICETGPFLRQLYDLYENITVTTLNATDAKAKEWLKKLGADRLPLYIFTDNSFMESPRSKNIQRYLAYKNGTYFINPLVTEVSALQRPSKAGSAKLYYTPLSSAMSMVPPVLEAAMDARREGMDVQFDLVPIVAQSRNQNPQGGGADQRFKVQVNTPQGVQSLYLQSQNGRQEILEGLHQACVMSEATDSQVLGYMQGFAEEVSTRTAGQQPRQIQQWARTAPLEKMRTAAYGQAMIGKDLQKKIQACTQNPNKAPRQLVEGFVDILNTRVMAAPTLLINNRTIVRGATPKLVEMLPELWAESLEGSE